MVVRAHFNAMQRKCLMQGDNTIIAFQQGPAGAVPTFIMPAAFSQLEHLV